MKDLANKITLMRIGAVPILVLFLYFPNVYTCWLATLTFMAAAASDLVDGWIARNWGQVTTFGKFLDPLADKLLVCAALVMLVSHQWIPAWIAVIIISRELIITGLRAVASEQGIVIAADRFGKIKMVLQILALIPFILQYNIGSWDPKPAGTVLLYLAVVLTVVSGANYMYNFYKTWMDT